MSNVVLEVKDLVIEYGAIRAVKGINLTVKQGSIVAILGSNGAGKTSTIRSLSGLTKIKSGEILHNGENIANRPTFKIAGLGIMQSPEGRMIINDLTVEENLLVGTYSLKKIKTKDENGKDIVVSVAEQTRKNLAEVYAYFPRLEERKKQQASTLSGGEQQMLAIGRALMGSPEILLLDEPSLGLAPLIIRDIFQIIEQIKEDGRTIVIVEQNAKQTLRIADYAYLLELGNIKKEGTGKELLEDEELINVYLGGS